VKSAFFYSDCRKKILRNIGVRVIDELLPEILSWLIAGLDRARGRSIPRSPFLFTGVDLPAQHSQRWRIRPSLLFTRDS
jgi:hypothetical protein